MARVHRSLLASLLLVGACGPALPASSEPVPPTTIGGESRAAPSEEVACEPAIDAFVALPELGALGEAARPGLGPDLLGFLAEVTTWRIDEQDVRGLLESLGIDPSGRLRFVVCAADASLQTRIDALARLVPEDPQSPAAGFEATVRDAFEEGPPSYMEARAFFPTTDAGRLEARITTTLGRGFESVDAPEVRDRVFVDPDSGTTFALTRLPSGIIVEFAHPIDGRPDGDAARRKADAVAAWRRSAPPRSLASPESAPEAGTIGVHVSPDHLARLNFAAGVGATLGALAGADPEARRILLPMGFAEAGESLRAAGTPGRSTFERLALRMDADGSVVLRFTARDANVLPSFEPSHRFALGVTADDGHVIVAPDFVRSLPLDAPSPTDAQARIERAGAFAGLYAMPQSLAAALQHLAAHAILERPDDQLSTAGAWFADVGVVFDADGETARVARVAPRFDPRAAACELARAPADCASRLRPGRALVLGDGRALLLQALGDEHLVVVAASAQRARTIGTRLVRLSPEDDGTGAEAVRATLGRDAWRRMNLGGFGVVLCPAARWSVTRRDADLVVRADRLFCPVTP